MEDGKFDSCQHQDANSWSCDSENKRQQDIEMGSDEFGDSTLRIPGSRLIPTGFVDNGCSEDIVVFVNAGCVGSEVEGFSSFHVKPDCFFEGGEVIRTKEPILHGGDMPFIYQSARYGNFCYRFENLAPGQYLVDLHFAEIISATVPKGMRVFDVFIQEEKVLSEIDISSIVGTNSPLQLTDVRVSLFEDRAIVINFQGVCGSPLVSGICIRRAPQLLGKVNEQYLKGNSFPADPEVPYSQDKYMRITSIAKYEKTIEDLRNQCKQKADECYEAWMTLHDANQQLQNVRAELDKYIIQNESLDCVLKKQAQELKDISSRYARDRKQWANVVNELDAKLKMMKEEHIQLSSEARKCADSIPGLTKLVLAVQTLVAECDDLKLKFNREQAERKKLYNQIQEAKGNIRVFCRCRPLNKEEISAKCATVVDFDAAKDGAIGILTGGQKKTLKFDRVYTPEDGQEQVFEDASPMVVSVLDGFNVCIFAYGQTGTGKTFTMEGTERNRGVNYRTLERLFEIAEERKENFRYNIHVSVLEVYNEQIRDLLATSPSSRKLEIKQTSEGDLHVPGIVEYKVENVKEVWDVLQVGSNARSIGSNNVNEHSSRSHCMLCVTVKARNLIDGECTKSKLWLVDLAGSERLSRTEAQGERLKEAQNINRSLAALGDVISALANKSSHIPFRNSKLTYLLQDSLGNDAKTLMFVQISPSEQDLGETLSSLNFATRVRGVELAPAKKQIDTAELQKTKMMLDKVKQDLRSKEDALQKLEGKANGKEILCRRQDEKINELEGQISLKEDKCRQVEKQLMQLLEESKGKDGICLDLHQKVKELEKEVKRRELAEAATLQRQQELEESFKERTQEFEHQRRILEQKIKELEEGKLKLERRSSAGSHPAHGKINGMESKVGGAQRYEEVSPLLLYAGDKLELSGNGYTDPLHLKRSVEVMDQGSVLLKGAEPLREVRRKRASLHKETENCPLIPVTTVEKKIRAPTEPNREKVSANPSRAFTRITRTAKPLVAGAHKELSGASRVSIGRSKVWLR